ncbi:MAG: PadR family transcriptional regulator [bacterium]|nr:PadR family transcriptional regulator [bacterium]
MNDFSLDIPNLTKSLNESLILSVLHKEKKHGYQLALEIEQKSSGMFKFNHGTLYPILHKLEKEGFIKGIWKKEGPKRKRKYYRLSARGKKYASRHQNSWRMFFDSLFNIIGEADQ